MLQECKYRLPCNWCDKYDRMCEAVLFEIFKEEQERNRKPEECEHECEHEWRYEGQLGNRHHYTCIKCNTLKAVPLKNLSSTDVECQHNWILEEQEIIKQKVSYKRYKCNTCGKEKIIRIEFQDDGLADATSWERA